MAEPTDPARPGFFPELRDLERDAAVLTARLRSAEAAAAESSGRDPSEQVRVVLAPSGRIASVELDRSRLDARDLASAVLAAYREASDRRLETWAAEIGRTDAGPPPARADQSPSPGTEPGIGTEPEIDTEPGIDTEPEIGTQPGIGPSTESIRRLWYLLQDATDRLDDLVREAADRSRAVVTGRDPDGHVTAALTGGGGELTELTVDEAWATEAGDREIGVALTAAITDGYSAVDQLAREATSQWPFPDLERLSGSPAALLATLGLPAIDEGNGHATE